MSRNALGNPTNLFAQRLALRAGEVEGRLREHLDRLATETPARLLDAMRWAALGGGKRFRPALVIESAVLFGAPAEAALDTAAAVEFVHCYSLVHDDLPSMDNDELRRGRATVHKAFDEWTAVLAGDALQTLAFDVLSRPEAHPDPMVRCDLVLGLARAAGATGMVGGQCLDLQADKLGVPAARANDVDRLQAMKTGALIAFACEAGAILGQDAPQDRDAVRRYGTHLGLAFQIADDILDATGDATILGKTSGKDQAAGKATLISLIGMDFAQARLRELEAEALAALVRFGGAADVLRDAARFVGMRRH